MGLPFLLVASVVLSYHCANCCAKDKANTARQHRYSKMLQLGTTIVLLVCVNHHVCIACTACDVFTFASHPHPFLFFILLLNHSPFELLRAGTLPCVKKSSPCCGAKPSKAWTTVRGTVVVVHVDTAPSTASSTDRRSCTHIQAFSFVFVSNFFECHDHRISPFLNASMSRCLDGLMSRCLDGSMSRCLDGSMVRQGRCLWPIGPCGAGKETIVCFPWWRCFSCCCWWLGFHLVCC